MDKQQEQLILLLINNSQQVREIEAIHKRCCIYYGIDRSLEVCQEIIDFANKNNIGLLESFRLQVEISELSTKRAGK